MAAGYALAFYLVRQLSFSHWVLLAGFRFSVLLFAPYRYWPALLVGEAGSLAFVGLACMEEFGWLWTAFFMVPPMLVSMPVIYWCREHGHLFQPRNETRIGVLLLGTFSASLLWAAVNTATLALMSAVPGENIDYQQVAARYFIGNYLGILTLVPLVLLVREEWLGHGLLRFWSRLSQSRLTRDAACVLLPSLAVLGWLASGVAGPATEECRMAMFLPVAWLSLRHGWRGTAVGGTAASIALVLVMPYHKDSATLHAQVFVAFTITTMLMLSARIAILHERGEREKAGARMALAMAQRNVYLGEIQLRQTSHALEQVSSAIQSSYTQLLGRLRTVLPGVDERTYYRQAAVTQHQMYRLADSLYPLAWDERGLAAVLREGAVPRALDEAGVAYWCDVRGREESTLPTHLQMALYRLAVEAVTLACAKCNITQIHVQLREGMFAGRRWAVLRVDSRVDYGRLGRIRWDDLHLALGGSGMGLAAIKDRAMVFGGKVRLRARHDGQRLSLILWEPEDA
jgi:glucose-6-phosphate-specific signal transduction histidine kinase